jgi:hypothetical protein
MKHKLPGGLCSMPLPFPKGSGIVVKKREIPQKRIQ